MSDPQYSFYTIISEQLFEDKPIPVKLAHFLKNLDRDKSLYNKEINSVNEWKCSELDTYFDKGVRSSFKVNPEILKEALKDNPRFSDKYFEVSLNIGQLQRDKPKNVSFSNNETLGLYKKHGTILFDLLPFISNTTTYLKEIGVENFDLLNFKLVEFTQSPVNDSGYGDNGYGGSNYGDSSYGYGSSYGNDSYGDSGYADSGYGNEIDKKLALLSCTLYSSILDINIELEIKEYVSNSLI